MAREVLKLVTRDGLTVVADYYAGTGREGVVLSHMMPADRKSWEVFALKLQESGLHALAIDLRGHGESQAGPAGYKQFSDAEHQASIYDIEAAADYLWDRGVLHMHAAGASIGANLSLQFLVENELVSSAILLSPGLVYRGIDTAELVLRVRETQAVYYVAAEDDVYSAESVKKLFMLTPPGAKKRREVFKSGGHGTNLFISHPELAQTVVSWLRQA